MGHEMSPDLAHEAQRQQALLRVLWRDAPAQALSGWMRTPQQVPDGLSAYRANAGAHAERALAAAYPTLQLLLGDESFAALARAHWQADPPLRGDLAQWGAGLPAFIADDAQLASEPYLADMARLDWAVHQAEQAADAQDVQGLPLLADVDALVKPALADGRLLPAMEKWARDLGKTDVAALTAYLGTAQPIAALTATQTKGIPPSGLAKGDAQLSADELAVCTAMGLTPDQYKAGAAA